MRSDVAGGFVATLAEQQGQPRQLQAGAGKRRRRARILRTRLVSQTSIHRHARSDLSVWRPGAGSLLEAPIPTLKCYNLHALFSLKADSGFPLLIKLVLSEICFQCFDAVGWATGRAPSL